MLKTLRPARVLGASCTLLVLTACATTSGDRPPDREDDGEPLVADRDDDDSSVRGSPKVKGSEPVAFFRLELEAETGVPIGINKPPRTDYGGRYQAHTWFLDEALERQWQQRLRPRANDRLKALGYTVPLEDNPLFGKDRTGLARYQIGALIKDVELQTRMLKTGGVGGRCQLTAEWQVYDTVLQKVVYSRVHEGSNENDDVLAIKLMTDALLSSMKGMLRDRRFSGVVKKTGEKKTAAKLSVGTCAKPVRDVPNDVERALDAVVVIRAGLGHGSGAFISDQGHILTAAHVVGANEKVMIKRRDGKELQARVLRLDDRQDVAVLKVDEPASACLALGKKRLAVGTEVYAIGTPLDEELAHTVSRGVVSAYREERGLRFLQSDVTVNPGNSGGPIVSPAGQLVGVASRKVVLLGFEGLSFHVPADTAVVTLNLAR